MLIDLNNKYFYAKKGQKCWSVAERMYGLDDSGVLIDLNIR